MANLLEKGGWKRIRRHHPHDRKHRQQELISPASQPQVDHIIWKYHQQGHRPDLPPDGPKQSGEEVEFWRRGVEAKGHQVLEHRGVWKDIQPDEAGLQGDYQQFQQVLLPPEGEVSQHLHPFHLQVHWNWSLRNQVQVTRNAYFPPLPNHLTSREVWYGKPDSSQCALHPWEDNWLQKGALTAGEIEAAEPKCRGRQQWKQQKLAPHHEQPRDRTTWVRL